MVEERKIASNENTGVESASGQSTKNVTVQEVHDVLMNDGYSAGERKTRLKNLLTQLEQENAHSPCSETEDLICTVKDVINRQQANKPVSDDLL